MFAGLTSTAWRAAVSVEYPQAYEYVDGGVVHPDWEGQTIPVPPRWVRDRANLPNTCEYACLAPEIAETFPAPARATLGRYVADWPTRVVKLGAFLVVAGSGASYQRRQWAAGAVVNEIIRAYGATSDLSVSWCSSRTVRWMLDARLQKTDTYTSLRNRLIKSRLLLAEEPTRIPPSDADARWLFESIIEERRSRKAPVIVTLSSDVRDGDWGGVKALLGPFITELLSDATYGYLAHL
jgi:hypothetical protein